MLGPTECSSARSSPVLILDQRSSLGSLIGWPACCGDFVVLARSKPASLRSRANYCSHPGQTCPAGPVNRGRCQLPPEPMAIAKPRARTDEAIGRPEIKNCCRRLCVRRPDHPTPSPNVSSAFPILTRPCLTAWAATKRDYGGRQRKRFGCLRRCDGRRLQCGNGCATGSRPSPGIGRGRSRLTQSLGIDYREDEVASAVVHWVNQG
jgi:hypothetical protein